MVTTRTPSPRPRRGKAWTLVVAAAVSSGCELAPLNVDGLRCTEARACGEGYVCHRERCVLEGEVPVEDAGSDGGVDAGLDAGPDAGDDAGTDAGLDAGLDAGVDAGIPTDVNLLANPGFESAYSDGGVASWRASTGRLYTSFQQRSGSRAARLTSSNTQQQMVLVPTNDESGTELGMLFCASLWVRAETDAGIDVTLSIRDRYADGGADSSAGTRITVRDTWRQVKEQHVSFGNSTLQFRLTSVSRFDAGEGYLVDDAVLMRSSTSFCP